VRLTTKQKHQAAALAVWCPVHKVWPGVPCPGPRKGAFGGACMDRRQAALAAVRPAELAEASR
jgi:hypothetical protein